MCASGDELVRFAKVSTITAPTRRGRRHAEALPARSSAMPNGFSTRVTFCRAAHFPAMLRITPGSLLDATPMARIVAFSESAKNIVPSVRNGESHRCAPPQPKRKSN